MDILQMSFSASVMIVAVVMIRALTLHRLPKRTFIALWGVVICRLLIPFSIPYRFSFYTGLELVKQLLSAQTATSVVSSPVVITGVTNIAELPATGEVMPSAPAATAAISPIFVAWLVGMCVCTLIFITAYLKCRREFKTSLPVQNDYTACWLREHALRRTVQIRQSDRIQAPLTYGVFRPIILLPKAIDWTDEAGLKVILSHELTHIRRFDTLLKLVLAAAVCVHWFNPFVWVMYALANRDIELTCDEAVVRALGENMKSAYALTLIDLEEKKSSLAPLISGFARNAIEERITAIMKIKKHTIPAVIVALFLVMGVTVAFATSNAAAGNKNDAYSALEQALKEEDAYSALKQVLEEMENISTATVSLSGSDYIYVKLTLDGTDTLDKEQAAQIQDLAKYAFSDKSIKINFGGAVEGGDSSIVGWTAASEVNSEQDINEALDTAEVGNEPSENEANASNNSWVWPVEGCDTVTSMFGKRVHPVSGITTENDHICISGDNADGAKVYAALAGTVLETGFEAEQGNYIIITHDNGIETSYRHLKEVLVSDGDPVAAGDTIGTVGKTGTATGPCLGFCVYVNGVAVNPLEYYQ